MNAKNLLEADTKPTLQAHAIRADQKVRTVCLVIIAIVAAGAALAVLKPILSPLLIALFLYYLIRPIGVAMGGWQVPRWFVFSVVLIVLTIVSLVFWQMLYSNIQAFEQQLDTYQEKATEGLDALARITGHANAEGKLDRELYTAGDVLHLPADTVVRFVFGTALEFLEVSLLVLFYLIFIYLEAYRLPVRIEKGLAPDTAEQFREIGHRVDVSLRRFLVTKTYISLGLGATTGLICWLFGLHFWLLWAVLMFLSNYITYIGSFVALIPPVLLALVQFENPLLWASAVAVALLLNRLVWIDYFEIRFLGSQLNISPLLLLLSIALFGFIWGMVGLVMAVPLMTTLKIVLSQFERSKGLAVLISEE